jgi:AcrR family transcriptional regulator
MNAIEKRFYQHHLQNFERERLKWRLLKAGHRLYMRGDLEIPDLNNIVITAGVPLRSFYASFPSGEAYIRSLLEWEIRRYYRFYRDSLSDDFRNSENICRWVERFLLEFSKGKNLVRLFWYTLSIDPEFINYFHQLKRGMVLRLENKIAALKGGADGEDNSAEFSQIAELQGIITNLESALLHTAFDGSGTEAYVVNEVVNRLVSFCCPANTN